MGLQRVGYNLVTKQQQKRNDTKFNLQNRKRLTDLENKLMVAGGRDS